MKRSLKQLLEFTIRDKSGNQGRVMDLLMDEDKWIIRYLEVDFGKEFLGKRVLISNQFLDKPEWSSNLFPIKMNRTDITAAPELKHNMPISRRYEEELNKHYKSINYWEITPAPTELISLYPPRPIRVPTKQIDERNLGTSLRSFNEVNGYHIKTSDGKLGHIIDFIVDDKDWQVVYAIVDTSNWNPWSKKVVIPVNLFDEISYENSEIVTGVETEIIKESPEYKDETMFSTDYEVKLYDYYIEKLAEKV